MSTLLKSIQVREELLNRNVRIFTPLEFTRIFNTPPQSTKYFLETQAKSGLFLRLKPGLYTLKTDLPGEEEIANALYRPSYVSLDYALAFYGLLPEMPYTITSATTKSTRLFTSLEKAYSYRTIKKSAFTGYILHKSSNRSYLIAEPEKALVDYYYFAILDRLQPNDRIRHQKLDRQKITHYAQLFSHPKLTSLLMKLPDLTIGVSSPLCFVGSGIPPKQKFLRIHPRANARGFLRRGIKL